MPANEIIFWTLIFAGATLSGWWLAIRPHAAPGEMEAEAPTAPREMAAPVAVLIMAMAGLLCILAVSGNSGSSVPGGLNSLLLR